MYSIKSFVLRIFGIVHQARFLKTYALWKSSDSCSKVGRKKESSWAQQWTRIRRSYPCFKKKMAPEMETTLNEMKFKEENSSENSKSNDVCQ